MQRKGVLSYLLLMVIDSFCFVKNTYFLQNKFFLHKLKLSFFNEITA